MLFKQCLDPTAESLHRTCSRLRREARDDMLLFHFSGHGVPAPSTLGEMWLFNDTYTEYVPVRATDVAEWVGPPAVFVLDCPHAGRVLSALTAAHPQSAGGSAHASLPLVVLGATAADERLPTARTFPADVFTQCLTRPLESALQLAVQRRRRCLPPFPPSAN
eukprot:3634522-Prymnesium_polylepis.1